MSDSATPVIRTLNEFFDELRHRDAAGLEAAADRTRDSWDAWAKGASGRLAPAGRQDALGLLKEAEQLFAGLWLRRCLVLVQVDTLRDLLAWVRFQRRVWGGIPDVAAMSEMPADYYGGVRRLLALVGAVQRAADGTEAGAVEDPGPPLPPGMRKGGLPAPGFLVTLAWEHAEQAREGAGPGAPSLPLKDPRILDLPEAQKELGRLEAWCLRAGAGDVPEAAAAGAKPPAGAGETTPIVYCLSWADLLNAVELKNNKTNRERVKNLNRQFEGPIILPEQGEQPRVDQAKLLSWWNGLEEMWRGRQQKALDAKATAAEQHPYGRGGTVVPGINGSVRKRRKPRG
jgi:hypothetical protein